MEITVLNALFLYLRTLADASGYIVGGYKGINICQHLKAPAHGTILCGTAFPFYTCIASCDTGYTFPNGLSEEKRYCDQDFGDWLDPGQNISDCQIQCQDTQQCTQLILAGYEVCRELKYASENCKKHCGFCSSNG